MSEKPIKPKLKLPKQEPRKETLTFQVPYILKSIVLDENGFTHREVREGEFRQIEHESTVEWSDTELDERNQLFVVRVTNQLNFSGAIINVINDEIALSNGFRLVPTVPTASEYLAKVGTRQMIAFMCRWDKTRFRIDRTFIIVP
jgi:hypothetical protein